MVKAFVTIKSYIKEGGEARVKGAKGVNCEEHRISKNEGLWGRTEIVAFIPKSSNSYVIIWEKKGYSYLLDNVEVYKYDPFSNEWILKKRLRNVDWDTLTKVLKISLGLEISFE